MTRLKQPEIEDLLKEIEFSTSRSSGPGGQNVNKLNTKVSLKFDVLNSALLNADQKELILAKLQNNITKEGILYLSSQDLRTQIQNKQRVLKKLEKLLIKAFTVKKVRKATKPTKASKHSRIKEKKMRGEKKAWRKKPD
jgi:ribosome-associated protein